MTKTHSLFVQRQWHPHKSNKHHMPASIGSPALLREQSLPYHPSWHLQKPYTHSPRALHWLGHKCSSGISQNSPVAPSMRQVHLCLYVCCMCVRCACACCVCVHLCFYVCYMCVCVCMCMLLVCATAPACVCTLRVGEPACVCACCMCMLHACVCVYVFMLRLCAPGSSCVCVVCVCAPARVCMFVRSLGALTRQTCVPSVFTVIGTNREK